MTMTVVYDPTAKPIHLATGDTLALTPHDEWGSCRFDAPAVLMDKTGFERLEKDARFGRAIRDARRGMPQWKRVVAHALRIY